MKPTTPEACPTSGPGTTSFRGDKQLLFDALDGKTTARPAWTPFVGVHGGSLIGVSAQDYLQSEDHIVAGLEEADRRYAPDGLPVVFDLQLEAEVLGCDLHWAQATPPSVASHPLSVMEGPGLTLEQLPAFDLSRGRFPIALGATRRLAASIGDHVALYGLLTGPFTLACHLMGNDIFLEMYDQPEKVKEVVDHCAEIGVQVARAYLDAGASVIAAVDPMTSQISSEHFEQFVSKAVNRVFDAVREAGGRSSLFVCGDATRNLEVMCATRCDNLSIDENIALEQLLSYARPAAKSVGGNMKLTTVLLLGRPEDAKLDAIRCIDACGDRGFVLAPGCDLPYDVKPENLEAVAAMAHDSYQRDVARATIQPVAMESFSDIELPAYGDDGKLWVDVITLDSAGCAPCQYMVAAARTAAADLNDPRVEVREHKVTVREGIGYMVRLGVQNIPTICINGRPEFVSTIPPRQELVNALKSAWHG